MSFSKITIPTPLILNAENYDDLNSLFDGENIIENEIIDFDRSNDLLINIMGLLLQNSAHEINLICNNEIEKEILKDVPLRLKNRMSIINSEKYLTKNFLSFIQPINNDDIVGPMIDFLLNELFYLFVASKKETLVDALSFLTLCKNFNQIFKNSKVIRKPSKRIFLNQLQSLSGLYEYQRNIERFIDTNNEIPIDRRLDDFLNDAYVENISKEQYFFGIPGKTKLAVYNFKQILKNTVIPKVKITFKPMFFANIPLNVNLGNDLFNQKTGYSPPISSIKSQYPTILNQFIKENSLDKLFFIDSSPFNRAGWIVNEYRKDNRIVRHLYLHKKEYEEKEYIMNRDWERIIIFKAKFNEVVFPHLR